MDTILSFGVWIKRRRKALDLTQDDLGRLVGCSLEMIRKIEGDARRPSRQVAALLAEHLALRPEEREDFIRCARAELGADRLPPPARSAPRAAFVPASLQPDTPAQDRTNLPAPPNALIGREREIAAVTALLRRDGLRLLTLTGPGGTGKTRLALQAAAELLDDNSASLPSQQETSEAQRAGWPGGESHFPDGVFFVNLAPIADPGLVATAIAQALGVIEVAGKPIEESLRTFLRVKRTLLLLDNFEQVLDAAPLVADLLAAVPGLKVLVTSRATLHLYGEHEFAVPPLALPPKEPRTQNQEPGRADQDTFLGSRFSVLPSVAELTQYEAVRLFIARARAAKADFAVTNANAPAVAEICYRLDGLPLAIELAAARIKLFDPEALLARLSNRLALLTGGPRDLPARQQTLRNTIAWSYDLLTEEEQTLFRRLGVFVGGCTLEAVEAVCGSWKAGVGSWGATPTPSSQLPTPVLEGLAALVDQSLLRREEGPDGEARFVMLETVREYAVERLGDSGETEEMRRRHAEYFMALAEMAEPELIGPAEQIWLVRLEADYNNLHAALAWSLGGQRESGIASREALELGLRLAGALEDFWEMRDRQSEGCAWIEAGLERSRTIAASLPLSVRLKALSLVGKPAVNRGDHRHATALWEESLALYRDSGDQAGVASALVQLGRVARNQGDYGRAERLEEESLALFRNQGDARGTTIALVSLGDAALEQGTLDRAVIYLQEALADGERYGLGVWTILASYNLGRVAYLRGDYTAALALLEESLAQFQNLDYAGGIGLVLVNLGRVAHAQGSSTTAAQQFAESVALLHEIPACEGHTAALEGLAGVAAVQGRPARAARLFGAVEALRESAGVPLPPAYRAGYERDVAAARAQLDEATFDAAWAAGRALTLEQAIAEALGESPTAEGSS